MKLRYSLRFTPPSPPLKGDSITFNMTSLKTIFGLAWTNLKNKKLRTFLVSLSVSVGVAVLFFFLSFAAGIEKFLLDDVTYKLDPRQLVVSYDYKNAGLFQVEADDSLRLDKTLIGDLKQLEGVEKVSPQLVLKIPVMAEIDFWDRYFETDVPVYGMDFNFLGVSEGDFQIEEGILPIVVSERILDIYNTSLAESTGLPRLSKEGLIGREMNIVFGESSFFNSNSEDMERVPARIVAFSNTAPVMGITIPLHEAEKVLQKFQNVEEEDFKYTSIYLQTTDAALNEEIEAKIEEKGFSVFTLQEAQKTINQVIWYVKKLVQVMGGIVLLIALSSVSMTLLMSVMERKQEIGILRALGMQRRSVAILVLFEGILIGIVAYALGMMIAFSAIEVTDYFLVKLTPDVAFKPASFFSVEWNQALFSFCFILFFVLMASFFPARKASRLDPLEALLK